MTLPGSTPPASSMRVSITRSQSSSVNRDRSPDSEKSCWAAKKVAEATRLSPLAAMCARTQDSRVPAMQ